MLVYFPHSKLGECMGECTRSLLECCTNTTNWTTVFFTSLFKMTVSLDVGIQMRWGKIHCIQK